MNVFTTKSGKVYKVSLRYFNAATGKKAPYYKRVKIDGRVVEKAYAICPGCGNPVHFVNLFNKKKQKKAHARHQRSSVRGLAKYNATAYKNCPYVLGAGDSKKNKTTKQEKKNTNKEIVAFSKVMTNTFGLTKENSDLLGEIYLKLKSINSSTCNQLFFAFMASATYNSTSLLDLIETLTKIEPEEEKKKRGGPKEFGIGTLWAGVGNIVNDDSIRTYLVALNFKEEKVKALFDELSAQHFNLEDASTPYYHKPDFTHLCATMATTLNWSGEKLLGTLAAGSVNGVYSADANAGYIGDVCGTDGIEPSINDGDYKSDLDAVNLAARLSINNGPDLMAVMSEYFNGVANGKINRAHEFKENLGLDTLNIQRDTYYDILRRQNQSEELSETELDSLLDDKLSVFDAFISHIESERNEW